MTAPGATPTGWGTPTPSSPGWGTAPASAPQSEGSNSYAGSPSAAVAPYGQQGYGSADTGYGQASNGYGQPAYEPAGSNSAYGGTGFNNPPVPYGGSGYGQPASGPIGKVRGTGVTILLCIVTLGIWSLIWYYQTHEEMKRHSGQGLGGGLALVLAFFIGIVMPYLTASEVGKLYERRGQQAPVSGATGLWYFPGIFILIGPLVWFIKTNGALNAYWRSLGAAG